MFINYEHENHIYNVTVECRKNQYFVTYDNTEYKVEADEIKHGHLKIKLGDRVIKCVITKGAKDKLVFVEGDVFKVRDIELTGTKKTKKKEGGDLNSPISGKVVSIKVKDGPPKKHRAICRRCKKEFTLIFKPTIGRPVYCNTCFKSKKRHQRRRH